MIAYGGISTNPLLNSFNSSPRIIGVGGNSNSGGFFNKVGGFFKGNSGGVGQFFKDNRQTIGALAGVLTQLNSENRGQYIASALNTFTGGISSIVAKTFGINLGENIDLVLKYGIGAWRAYRNPKTFLPNLPVWAESMDENFEKMRNATTIPAIEKHLNELVMESSYFSQLYKANMRRRRRWDRATRTSWREADKYFSAYHKGVEKAIAVMEQKGIVFEKTQQTARFGDWDNIFQDMRQEEQTTAEKAGSFNYYVYKIVGLPQPKAQQGRAIQQGKGTAKTSATTNNSMITIALAIGGLIALKKFKVI